MTDAQPPRHAGSEPGESPVPLAVTRLGPSAGAQRLPTAVWVVAAFVIVAVLKPWGGGGPVEATLRPDVAAPAVITPVPTEDRSATGLAIPVCLGSGGWRVATLETWRLRNVRVWRAIEPVDRATGPLDPAIPAVPVVADAITGLGWCAPAFGPDEPAGPAQVRAWQVIGVTDHEVALRQVQPAGGVTPIAALYLPVSGAWTSGRIVFEYRDEGTGAAHWFAADLQILAPAPSASPGSPGAGAALRSTTAP